MTYSLAQWENNTLDRHLDGGQEYNYDDFTDLPCEWVLRLKRWVDVETHLMVSHEEAIQRNDRECEKQAERNRDWENVHDRED